jgi:hypothetical protein
MPATNDDLIGYWKITKMEVWGQAYVDLVVPAFVEFEMEDDHLMGQFQFGTVVGWLDCHQGPVKCKSRAIGGPPHSGRRPT